ncbi:MAG: hypothetical protein EOO02_21080 [Chitinophagaceae bacterium]|nr:MAG: hypothetical protein EOO02_21080 [Chitinophagaceae bacterium]
MQRYIFLVLVVLFSAVTSVAVAQDTPRVTSIDPDLLALQTARVPKEYTIRSIRVQGVTTLDTAIVLSISGLRTGDKVTIPGSDVFAKAINNLWRQRFFSNVEIYITAVKDDFIDLELNVAERPKLGNFTFYGIRKSEKEDIIAKLNLVKGTIITENTKRNAKDVIEKYYQDKGYMNVQINIEEAKDPAFINANSLSFYIDKRNKVRVNEINFFGNETVSDLKLKKQFKETKEMSKLRSIQMKRQVLTVSRKGWRLRIT